MKIPRLLVLSVLLVIAASWFSFSKTEKRLSPVYFPKHHISYSAKDEANEKLQQKAAIAARFVQEKGFNESTCFLIDMSLPSGRGRFFIYNLKKDSLESAGLVAHGNCFQNWLEGRKYSNKTGGGCTSLGKYSIGIHYIGKFGYSYKLHGLDTTNNNAFERTVVLHSHSCIPDSEIADEICQSNGCPTVSPNFLEQLKTIINSSKKPVLLWIYN
jgi:hypothetical protein